MEVLYLINQQYNRTAMELIEDGTVIGSKHNNSLTQQWTVTRSDDGRTVTIRNVRYGKYLNVKGKLAAGAPLIGSDEKRDWQICGTWPILGLQTVIHIPRPPTHFPKTSIQIAPYSPALTDSANGTPVVLQKHSSSDNQKWLFRPPRLYFGYGSNLLHDRMDRQYIGNKFVGPAIIIGGWKWIIDNLGWVNIVRSPDDLVYGLVYELSLGNEDTMDTSEGYPDLYNKKTVGIELEVNGKKTLAQGLIYLDENNLEEGTPTDTYITVTNVAIKDAVPRGIPQWYVDEYIRKFVPAE